MSSLSAPPKEFFDFAKFLARKGPLWIQAAGGNISAKEGDHLWIKSSGMRMKDFQHDQFFTLLSLKKFLLILEQQSYVEALSESRVQNTSPKPSIETAFHAFLPRKFVAHFHSLPGIAMARRFFREPSALEDFLQEFAPSMSQRVCCLGYAEPGLPLAHEIQKRRDCEFFLMENHGVLVQGDSTQILRDYENLENQFCREFGISSQFPVLSKQKIDFLFPDFAIYFPKLQEFLVAAEENCFELNSEAPLDLKEVWLAHCWLKANVPELQELSQSAVESILKSPVEVMRMKQMKG